MRSAVRCNYTTSSTLAFSEGKCHEHVPQPLGESSPGMPWKEPVQMHTHMPGQLQQPQKNTTTHTHYPYTQTSTQTHNQTHICRHLHRHTTIYTEICTYAQMSIQICTQPYISICKLSTHAHKYTIIYTHRYRHIQRSTQRHRHTTIYTYADTYTHTQIHRHGHMTTCTYTQIYTTIKYMQASTHNSYTTHTVAEMSTQIHTNMHTTIYVHANYTNTHMHANKRIITHT